MIKTFLQGKRFEVYSSPEYYPKQQLYIKHFTQKEFFNLDTLEFIFEDEKDKSFEHIFIFDTQNWRKICDLFARVFINISGGSNSKKHKLSPINHRLSLFLICLYGGANSSNEVNKSFHANLGKDGKKVNDFTIKNNQNIIINFIKSNEEIKKIILAASPLREQELINKEINNEVSEEDLNESKT